MATEIIVEIHASEIAEIVESVFATMMGLKACECEVPWAPNANRLTSAVHLAGDWCGAVLLECDRYEASRFAVRFLTMGAPDSDIAADILPGVVNDVVRDVLGELANMIGGNLKCVLNRGTRLSLPSVVDGDFSLRVCGAAVRERLNFRCDEGVFWITVLTTHS
jgi:chemotaxis protein CheX